MIKFEGFEMEKFDEVEQEQFMEINGGISQNIDGYLGSANELVEQLIAYRDQRAYLKRKGRWLKR